MEWIVGGIVVICFIAFIVSGPALPGWARAPCTKCGSQKMAWEEGSDSGSTGEARFVCESCNHREFRGGWCSEIALEKIHGRPH